MNEALVQTNSTKIKLLSNRPKPLNCKISFAFLTNQIVQYSR